MTILSELTAETFDVEVGPIVTAPVLRRKLLATPTVRAVIEAVSMQVVTDADLSVFVADLIATFVPGKRFHPDLALAALAVVLESRSTEFASDFLEKLSKLRLVEMGISIAMAKECLRHRNDLAATVRKNIALAQPQEASKTVVLPPPTLSSTEALIRTVEF